MFPFEFDVMNRPMFQIKAVTQEEFLLILGRLSGLFVLLCLPMRIPPILGRTIFSTQSKANFVRKHPLI